MKICGTRTRHDRATDPAALTLWNRVDSLLYGSTSFYNFPDRVYRNSRAQYVEYSRDPELFSQHVSIKFKSTMLFHLCHRIEQTRAGEAAPMKLQRSTKKTNILVLAVNNQFQLPRGIASRFTEKIDSIHFTHACRAPTIIVSPHTIYQLLCVHTESNQNKRTLRARRPPMDEYPKLLIMQLKQIEFINSTRTWSFRGQLIN